MKILLKMKMKTTMPQMVHCPFEQGLSRTGPTLNSNAAETNHAHTKPESIRYSRDKPPEDNTIKFLDTDYAQPTETSNIDAETAKTRTKYHKQTVFSKHMQSIQITMKINCLELVMLKPTQVLQPNT